MAFTWVDLDAPCGSKGISGVIIPRKTVSELQKVVGEGNDEPVLIELSDTRIRFSISSLILTSKLIDGTFPEYHKVIPSTNKRKLIVNRAAFAASVNRISTVSGNRGRAVKLSITTDQLILTANNPDSGTAEDHLAVEYSGDAMEIGFNFRYLLDIASHLSGEDMMFMLADSCSPALIRDVKMKNALYVLMPMRI